MNWRKDHKQEMKTQLQAFLDKVYRKGQSQGTVAAKYNSVAHLCSWKKKLPDDILSDIKKGGQSPYKLLDEYTTYLSKCKMAPQTIALLVGGVKKWLRHNDVEISNEKFREVVDIPTRYGVVEDRIPTNLELRDMVYTCDPRGKALLMVLATSGMRVGECLSLRVGDVDFAKHPVRIHLRPQVTKARRERYTFISDEATTFLKEYLGGRTKDPANVIFWGRSHNRGRWENRPMTYWNSAEIFRNALKNAGVTERGENGYHKLHVHSLRKFAFTKMLGALGRDIAEAVLGHTEFLDAAYRRYTIDELGEMYLKGMDNLSIDPQLTEIQREAVQEEVEARTKRLERSNSELQAELVEIRAGQKAILGAIAEGGKVDVEALMKLLGFEKAKAVTTG